MRRKLNTGLLMAFLLLVLNSCSGEKVEVREEFSTPEKTYKMWLETAEKGDIANNIRCVTEASKRIMDSQMTNMDEFMKRSSENIKVFKTYSLSEQKIKGDKAVVVLKALKGDILVVPLKKEAEGWKIDLVSLFSGIG